MTRFSRIFHRALIASCLVLPAWSQQPQFFRITPVRPVAELRAEALKAHPPAESGSFRPADLVELIRLDPTIKLDIRYATDRNFLGTPVYEQARAFLQRPAAEALLRAHRKLRAQGYGLLIHDAYRPWYITKVFWDATPADKHEFVADPKEGSRHNRGCAVDLTLYDLKTGEAVAMPSLYDEMTPRAYSDYAGGTAAESRRRALLKAAMESEGFTQLPNEWWHFDYKDWKQYRVLNLPFDRIGTLAPAAGSPLGNARQVIVVTTRDWSADEARLERYQRQAPGRPWEMVGEPFNVMVGKNGLGWGRGLVALPADGDEPGPVKKEGDGKAPAGVFRLGNAFGYSPQKFPHSKMPYRQLTSTVECPDDTASSHYNTLVDRSQVKPDWNSSEQMLRPDTLYLWGIFVDHNSDPAQPGAGSCIFLHIWRGPGRPTVGCTAMAPEKMEEMLSWLDPRKSPRLVQLPEAEYQRLQAAWSLPPR